MLFYFDPSVMCEKPEDLSVRKRRSAEVRGRPASPGERSRRSAQTVRVVRQAEAELETEAELATRSYGSVLRYQCGLARRSVLEFVRVIRRH